MDPSNPERDQWMLAMKDEIESLRAHGTWLLTSVPPRQRVLSGRWLFVKKMGTTGLVERYKARFVVKGFLQRPGVDFSEVYHQSPLRLGLEFFYLPSLIGRCLLGSWILKLPFSMVCWNLTWTCTVTSLKASGFLDLMALHLCVSLSSPFMV